MGPLEKCCICNQPISDTEDMRRCAECYIYFHYGCNDWASSTSALNLGRDDSCLCPLCGQGEAIAEEQSRTAKRIKLAADKMLETSKKKVHAFEVGDCVLVPVPKVDRGPSDPPNLISVITDKKNGVYQVGSPAGIIKQWFSAETLLATRTSLLTAEDVNRDEFLSIREAVTKTSGGQGFSKCNCKPSTAQCRRPN